MAKIKRKEMKGEENVFFLLVVDLRFLDISARGLIFHPTAFLHN
jgi:hypothetical protein